MCVALVQICFPFGFLMCSLWLPYVSSDFRGLPKIITRCEGSHLGVALVQICFPYGFLMVSLWLPYVSFDSRGLPKIITRCWGAFCVLLWCKYDFLSTDLIGQMSLTTKKQFTLHNIVIFAC